MTDIKFDNPVSFFVNEEKTAKPQPRDLPETKPKMVKAKKTIVNEPAVEDLSKPAKKDDFRLNELEKLYTPTEAAKMLNLHIATIQRKIRENEIKAIKKGGGKGGGGRYYIPESQILAYLNSDNG